MRKIPLLACLIASPLWAQSEPAGSGVDAVIAEILKLEQKREPKCYATASRLEDFMYGTPLSAEARQAKNLLQAGWVDWIWRQASDLARKQDAKLVAASHIHAALAAHFSSKANAQGHFDLGLNGRQVQVNGTDKRQYSTVAYSLRAVLAVQQGILLGADDKRLFLEEPAVAALADALDLVTLAALKVTDEKLRLENRHEVDPRSLSEVWLTLSGQPAPGDTASALNAAVPPAGPADLSLLRKMITQKLASYAAYNNVSQQLFMRNLQVYFARARWPEDESASLAFRSAFTEAMIQFTRELYAGAEAAALKSRHARVMEADVAEFAHAYIPHRINAYEDAVFFPRLPRSRQIAIEAYDMDAFRDPGWHWRYLEAAINEPDFGPKLQLDPFAAELLTENVAQFGVLLLRTTGEVGRSANATEIAPAHLQAALKDLQQRIFDHAQVPETADPAPAIVSSDDHTSAAGKRFEALTGSAGIDFMHRNSDWLSRQLRSYLSKDAETGVITIPPAFGGAGVAADDINNDGRIDLLLLSGLGNRLYLNRGDKGFEDVTQTAGLDWRRSDSGLPGEPRQPLIADLDNDGLRDIVITYVDDSHRVYRNLDGEHFEDVTERAGLGGKSLVGGPATVFDYDGDGLLDLYVQYFGNYLQGVLPTLARRNDNADPDRLWRNLGGFRFEDVTAKASVGDPGWGQSVTHSDLNGDGRQDLISGNDFGTNRYYINQGNGSFVEQSAVLGTDKPTFTMSLGIADLNRDLYPDVYVSSVVTMNKDETYIMPNVDTPAKFNPEKLKNMRVVEGNDLFISQFKGGQLQYFPSNQVGRGRSSTGWSWDADFFDYDNDGDDDLYVLNGMNEYNVYSKENPYYTDPLENKRVKVEFPDAGQSPNVFFENRDGMLDNQSESSGLDFVGNSRSAAYLDLDNDGDLDVVTLDYQGPARLFRNRSESLGHHYLAIELVGDPSRKVNRDAIGARLVLSLPDGSRILREIRGSEGYMSVHPKRQMFGLGRATSAQLSIRWPDGREQRVDDLTVDTLHRIPYPAEGSKTSP